MSDNNELLLKPNRKQRRTMWKRLVRRTNRPLEERSDYIPNNPPFKHVENPLELSKKTWRRRRAERKNRNA